MGSAQHELQILIGAKTHWFRRYDVDHRSKIKRCH